MKMARRNNTRPVAVFEFDPSPRDPVAPEGYLRSESRPNIDWAGMVGAGENPNGFTAQTANGTQHDQGNGHNQWGWGNRANGKRWGGDNLDWGKHGNRTGE